LLGNTDSKKQAWVELPPIQILGNNLFLSQNSNVLLKDNITQRPIVFTNSGTNLKSVVITSANIWKWKLLASNKELNLFDNFILNAIKWLSIENDKNGFSVQPSKNNYKLGEKIIFSANLFDSTLEPISDAKIFLETQNGDANETVYFTQQGNGLYEAEVLPKNAGQLIFNASVEDYEQNLSSVNGKINIEAIDIESIERRMNKPLLQSIADNSNAVYASLNEIEKSLFKMNEQFENKIYFKNTDKELRLSNFEIILIIVVLLFSIEWILRKWLRML
jgi:hypothetical protein